MEILVKRTMDRTTLYIEAEGNPNSFELEMLRRGIPGMLKATVESYQNHICFAYDITQKISLTQYLKHEPINTEFISIFLNQLIQIIRSGKEYLLEDRGFLLRDDAIYMGSGPRDLFLCYIVGYDVPLQEQFTALFEGWMEKIDYSDRNTVQLVYDLHRISRLQTCTFDDFLTLLNAKEDEQEFERPGDMRRNRMEGPEKQEIASGFVGLEETVTGEKEELYYPRSSYFYFILGVIGCILCNIVGIRIGLMSNHYGRLEIVKVIAGVVLSAGILFYLWQILFVKKGKLSRMISTVESVSLAKEPVIGQLSMQQTRQPSYDVIIPKTKGEGDTSQGTERDMEVEERTQLLCEDKTQLLYQKRALFLKPMEERADLILIQRERNLIGSSHTLADVVIDEKTVSRKHAEILYKEGDYYIRDLKSTNGTYINGIKVEKEKMEMLHNADEIRFAGCTYQVVIQE